MKQIFRFSLLLLVLLLPDTIMAHDFTVDGIYYLINGTHASVTYRGSYSDQYYNEYTGDVIIPSTVAFNGTTYSVTSIGDAAFSNCSGLSSITIPNSIKTISDAAFLNCTSLTSIDIPNSVTSIGNYAFYGCSGLTSVTIPSSVISIDVNPFARCTNLSSIKVADDNQFYDSRDNSNTIIEIASNSLITACNSSFIPNSVTSIGNYAFYGCNGLTSINIPNSVTSIGDYAFYYCSNLTCIDIPNSVTEIGEGAFRDCTGLTSIDIPNSVVTIGSFAFDFCIGLKSAIIPNSVINIGENVFSSVLIPTLTIEGEGVWPGGGIDCSTNCLSIDSRITSVNGMKVNASNVYCYSTTPPICDENSFTDYSGTLHVPATSLSSYFIADYWSNFANIVGDAVELTDISISRDSVEVSIGTIFSMTATLTPANATPSNIIWRSTDTAIATVNNGKITAVGIGECDIIAQCLNKKAICHMVVNDTVITITLDKQEAKVLPNHTLILNPGAYPIMVDGFVVSSSNPNVAVARIMNGKVQVVGIKEGTTLITVGSTDGTAIPATCIVTVYTEEGDVTCDGYVNITDVTNLIDFLLSNDIDGISLENADCDKDDKVNISDVTLLIDYLLGGLWPWEYETFTVNGVTFKMIAVKGGTFTMGRTAEQGSDIYYEGDLPTHQVTLTKDYFIGETEVTQALWLAVMGSNPSHFTGNLQRPVEMVSWNDCMTFINRLNQMTGMAFRLPTEAEWEFAARGGTKSEGYKFAGSNNVDEVAWYRVNAYDVGSSSPNYGTHAVGTKNPNELHLYDMSGNVEEWCMDWYSSYSNDEQTDPTGPTSGNSRVSRGSYYANNETQTRVSVRWSNYPYQKFNGRGLRLAL